MEWGRGPNWGSGLLVARYTMRDTGEQKRRVSWKSGMQKLGNLAASY